MGSRAKCRPCPVSPRWGCRPPAGHRQPSRSSCRRRRASTPRRTAVQVAERVTWQTRPARPGPPLCPSPLTAKGRFPVGHPRARTSAPVRQSGRSSSVGVSRATSGEVGTRGRLHDCGVDRRVRAVGDPTHRQQNRVASRFVRGPACAQPERVRESGERSTRSGGQARPTRILPPRRALDQQWPTSKGGVPRASLGRCGSRPHRLRRRPGIWITLVRRDFETEAPGR
jgi:hypothetical protein